VIGIAIVIAVAELRCDFSQIAYPDWFAAHHTETFGTGRPAIYKHESHATPSGAKQNKGNRISSGIWPQNFSGGFNAGQPSAVSLLTGFETVSALF
jgi:hypothetical protein